MPTLSIDIEARFAKFQDGLDSIQRDVDKAVGGLEKSFSRLGAGIGAIVAGVGAGSLAGAFKSTVDQLSAFGDAADTTGASVEELSSLLNTLRPYGGSLSEITEIAGRLTKAMRDSDEETSKAAGAFKALGVSTKDASGNFRPLQDVLEDVAESLNGYADGTNKAALAQDIFGRVGEQYLARLKDLANAQRESETLTAEQVASAKKFSLELGKLSSQLDAFRVSLVGPVLTSLNNFIAQLRVGTDAAGGFFSALTKFGLSFGSPEENIGRLTKKIEELNAAVAKDSALADGRGSAFGRGARAAAAGRVKSAQAEIDQALKDLQYFRLLQEQAGRGTNLRSPGLYDAAGVSPQAPRNAAGEQAKAAKEQITDGERLLKQLQDRLFTTLKLTEVQKLESDIARGAIKFDNDRQAAAALSAAAQIDSAKEIVDLADRESKSAIERISRYEELEATQSRANEQAEKAIKDQVQGWEDLANPMMRYQRELERINKLLESNNITGDQANRFRSAQIAAMVEEIKQSKKKTEDADKAAKDLGLTFQSAFEDAIIEGRKLSEVLQGLAKDVARVFLRKTVTEPLGNAVSGFARNLFGGASGGDEFNPYVGLSTKAVGASSGMVVQNITLSGEVGRGDVANAVNVSVASAKAAIMDSMSRRGPAWRAA